jgi:hypothetical protein
MNDDDEDLVRRAYAAYFRGGQYHDQPSSSASTVEVVDDKFYVVLRNVNGVLAVYRVRNDGILKGLKRWPRELEPSRA